MHEEYADRFWAKVDKSDLNGCWPWAGSCLPKGYGRFYPKWKVGMYAHRVSWEMANDRPLKPDEHVCHRCDNPVCVNPSHLFAGSRSDNMQDCLSKGRFNAKGSSGESHPGSKLTEDQVREIRRRWAAGGVRQHELAAEFGVTRALIGFIVRRESWKHLSEDPA